MPLQQRTPLTPAEREIFLSGRASYNQIIAARTAAPGPEQTQLADGLPPTPPLQTILPTHADTVQRPEDVALPEPSRLAQRVEELKSLPGLVKGLFAGDEEALSEVESRFDVAGQVGENLGLDRSEAEGSVARMRENAEQLVRGFSGFGLNPESREIAGNVGKAAATAAGGFVKDLFDPEESLLRFGSELFDRAARTHPGDVPQHFVDAAAPIATATLKALIPGTQEAATTGQFMIELGADILADIAQIGTSPAEAFAERPILGLLDAHDFGYMSFRLGALGLVTSIGVRRALKVLAQTSGKGTARVASRLAEELPEEALEKLFSPQRMEAASQRVSDLTESVVLAKEEEFAARFASQQADETERLTRALPRGETGLDVPRTPQGRPASDAIPRGPGQPRTNVLSNEVARTFEVTEATTPRLDQLTGEIGAVRNQTDDLAAINEETLRAGGRAQAAPRIPKATSDTGVTPNGTANEIARTGVSSEVSSRNLARLMQNRGKVEPAVSDEIIDMLSRVEELKGTIVKDDVQDAIFGIEDGALNAAEMGLDAGERSGISNIEIRRRISVKGGHPLPTILEEEGLPSSMSPTEVLEILGGETPAQTRRRLVAETLATVGVKVDQANTASSRILIEALNPDGYFTTIKQVTHGRGPRFQALKTFAEDRIRGRGDRVRREAFEEAQKQVDDAVQELQRDAGLERERIAAGAEDVQPGTVRDTSQEQRVGPMGRVVSTPKAPVADALDEIDEIIQHGEAATSPLRHGPGEIATESVFTGHQTKSAVTVRRGVLESIDTAGKSPKQVIADVEREIQRRTDTPGLIRKEGEDIAEAAGETAIGARPTVSDMLAGQEIGPKTAAALKARAKNAAERHAVGADELDRIIKEEGGGRFHPNEPIGLDDIKDPELLRAVNARLDRLDAGVPLHGASPGQVAKAKKVAIDIWHDSQAHGTDATRTAPGQRRLKNAGPPSRPPPNGPHRVGPPPGSGGAASFGHTAEDLKDTRRAAMWSAFQSAFFDFDKAVPWVAGPIRKADRARLEHLSEASESLMNGPLQGVKKGGRLSNYIARTLDGQTAETIRLVDGFVDGKLFAEAERRAVPIREMLKDLFDELKIQNPDLKYVTNYVTYLRQYYKRQSKTGRLGVLSVEMPADMARMLPDKVWNSHLLRRTVDFKPKELDIIESLSVYLPTALRDIHMSPTIANARAIVEASGVIDDVGGLLTVNRTQLEKLSTEGLIDAGAYNDAIKAFDQIEAAGGQRALYQWEQAATRSVLDRLVGRPVGYEAMVDNVIRVVRPNIRPRPMMRTVIATNNAFYMGLLGLNPAVAAKNLTQNMNTIGRAGLLPTLRGVKNFTRPRGKPFGLGKDDVWFPGFEEASSVKLTASFSTLFEKDLPILVQAKNPLRAAGRGIQKLGFSLMTGTEFINRGTAFHTGFTEALRKGATMEEAVIRGIALSDETQFVYDALGKMAFAQGPIERSAMMLLTFPHKQVQFLATMPAAQLARYMAYMGFMQWYTSSVFGTVFPGVFGDSETLGSNPSAAEFARFVGTTAAAGAEFTPDLSRFGFPISPPLQAAVSTVTTLTKMAYAMLGQSTLLHQDFLDSASKALDDVTNAFPGGLMFKNAFQFERNLRPTPDHPDGAIRGDAPLAFTGDSGLVLQLPFVSQSLSGGDIAHKNMPVKLTPFNLRAAADSLPFLGIASADLPTGPSINVPGGEATLEFMSLRSPAAQNFRAITREMAIGEERRTQERTAFSTRVKKAIQDDDVAEFARAVDFARREGKRLGIGTEEFKSALSAGLRTELERHFRVVGKERARSFVVTNPRFERLLRQLQEAER